MTSVDVVVVTYRSEASIESCLGAALAIPDLGKVVVVDHGDDRSHEIAEALGATVVVDSANPGFGAGQNRGVQLTSSPYVLLLNPDAVVDAAVVARGIELLDAQLDVAAVQGVIRSARDGDTERSQGVEPRPVHLLGRALGARRLRSTAFGRAVARRSRTLTDHVEREPCVPVDVEYLAATALLVRREAFDAVGGLDTSYFLYGEDIDLGRRFRVADWRLVALPGVWAVHENGASSASSRARELEWWRGTMRFTARWWTAPEFAVALFAASLRVVWLGRGFRALLVDPLRQRLQKPSPAGVVRHGDTHVVG